MKRNRVTEESCVRECVDVPGTHSVSVREEKSHKGFIDHVLLYRS